MRQQDDVQVIGVPNPNDGDDAARQAFIDQMSTPVPQILDDPGSIWVEHGVLSQPSWVFVSADGTADLHIGGLGPQGLLERLQSL